jgi:hypothetical protein
MSNTGGPAFPTEHTDTSGLYDGMTLRDYFAAKAMQSYLNGDDRDSFTFDEWAKASYQMADAMLRAREQK